MRATDFTSYRIYSRPSLFQRLCKRLDAHPAMVLLLLVASGYIGVLLAQMFRHMAIGSW